MAYFELSKLSSANLIYSKRSNPNSGNIRDKVALKTTCLKNVKIKIIKTRTGCQCVGYSEN